MKDFIKNRIREELLRESIQSTRINDIENDDLYDSLIDQANKLSSNSEIGFGSAEPFGVLYDTNTGELAGATWLESSSRFTWHIIIKPKYRGKGYSKPLLDDLMAKYEQMKSYMGKDYKMVVNVVNDNLASTLLTHYGLKKLEDNGQGGVIMTNESTDTSQPIVINIMKNPEAAPNMGSRFGQDVEPSGTYVLQQEKGDNISGWLVGKAILKKPLMIKVTDNTLIQYKRDLALQYKAKGKTLTNKLMQKGFDALITVKQDGSYGEIVLFPNAQFMLH